ncbi:DUF2946 family protein [Massilia arenosa]|uniref:DUF2946 family protein n=1 Tax=Zemynaea arenosa TaxID=2561931 RepID=A0A4Y9SMB1_9BURK|nr:DUF2946 family protein [Massilia arenosa]TFW25486.1 DUF2946 family protein [Massilia arenosa]
MDDIVKQAVAKWPNVPHCYGWLALDARGVWRMRDENAQRLQLAGDKLTNPQLVGFINRNYQHDERGCWYFQNGPQRVYLNLETTPFIARTDPAHGLVLHTGEPVGAIDQVCLTEHGEIIVRAGDKVAQVDDRDTAQLLGQMELAGVACTDEALLAWMQEPRGHLVLRLGDAALPVKSIVRDALPAHFGYVREPAA